MPMIRFPALLVVPSLLGCSPTSATPARSDGMIIETPPAASPSAAASAPRQGTAPPSVVGAWEGGSCEGRGYIRRLSIDGDGTFMATDLVAPCPRGATCAWSGLILWKGTWRQEGTRVILDADRSTKLPDGVPKALAVEEGAHGMIELRESNCRYLPVR